MSLNKAETTFLKSEEDLLLNILNSLNEQIQHLDQREKAQSLLARDLTSEIVNTKRAEEKVQVYSDEAVAHGLVKKSRDSIKIMQKQLKDPYFARIELLEDLESGEQKTIEYKLGKYANPDCRIIDWRKAPIAKLYYEYNEGDLYDEVIQEKERSGEITLKNSYKIEEGKIQEVICRHGSFVKENNSWQKKQSKSAPRQSYSSLADILALITPEQFQSITVDHDLPVLIQGVAGSGKTAVAIHRLAWLLHEDNSNLNPQDILFTLKSPALYQYVQNSISDLEEEKSIQLLLWKNLLQKISPKKFAYPEDKLPIGGRRILYSKKLWEVLKQYLDKFSDFDSALQVLLNVLKNPQLSEPYLHQRISQYAEESCLDAETCVVILNLLLTNKPDLLKNTFQHVIIDEVQDFSAQELHIIFSCLKNTRHVTLMGDINQSIAADFAFPGWDHLKREIGIQDDSEIIQLRISHRSTLPIIKFCEAISDSRHSSSGRSGKAPIWFQCRREDKALHAAIHWLQTAQNKYPHSLSAVICADRQSARNLAGLLKPTFGEAVRLLEQDFSLGAGIIVTDVSQVKGLEFFNVLIWDISAKNYPPNELSKRQIYVAASRAEENLCLISIGKPAEILAKAGNLLRKFIYD